MCNVYVCVYVCMCVCVYVCMCVYVCVLGKYVWCVCVRAYIPVTVPYQISAVSRTMTVHIRLVQI